MALLIMPKRRSICIAGPPGSGKRFLVKALATDMGKLQLSSYNKFVCYDSVMPMQMLLCSILVLLFSSVKTL